MAFSLDPAALIGNAIQGLIGQPVIIGLPSTTAKIPNFVIGIVPEEQINMSVTLPPFQLSAGDLFLKSAVNPGSYTMKFILSQDPMLSNSQIATVATMLQQFTGILNSIANFGAVLPNLSGVSSNYAVSQLATLRTMKNNAQPILLLNAFITLGSISQNSPYLSSNWYIETVDATRMEAEGGGEVTIKLKELLTKRGTGILGNVANFANEIIGPGVGSAFSSWVPGT